jgi:hypothetical protein
LTPTRRAFRSAAMISRGEFGFETTLPPTTLAR